MPTGRRVEATADVSTKLKAGRRTLFSRQRYH